MSGSVIGKTHSYRPDIDGLRALAVMPVVLFHAGSSTFSGGFVGVDIFFVISGFLITGILLREVESGRYSILKFYERRVRRIFPALFVVVGCTYVIGVKILLPDDFVGFAKSIIATALFASNMLFWSEAGYFDAPAEMKPLLHTWSLAVEEQYYILFPLALFVLFRWLKIRGATVWVALAALASLALSEWAVQHTPVAAFYLLPTRAWELLLGSLLAMGLVPRISSFKVAEAASLAGFALILGSVSILTRASTFPGLTALAPCLGTVLIIHAGTDHLPAGNRLLSLSPIRFIGLVSYSLYLWHWPIIVFTKYVWIEELTVWLRILVVVASAAAAVLTWKYVETPFRDPKRVSRNVVFAVGGCVMVVAIVAAFPGIRSGLPGRLPSQVVTLADVNAYRDTTGGCHMAYSHHLKVTQLCKRGALDRPASFILVGDSHAGAVAGGVFEGAKEAGLAGLQLTDSGYRPLFGLASLDEPTKYRWMNSALAEVLEDPSIRTVLIVAYWHQAVTRYRFRTAAGDLVKAGPALELGLMNLIRSYPDRNFILMTAPPAAPIFGSSAAARALLFARELDMTIPRSKFYEMSSGYVSVLNALAEEPNVDLLDITDLLCDKDTCHGKLDGILAYRDDNHLTNAVAMRLSSRFRDAFLSTRSGGQHLSKPRKVGHPPEKR